MEPILVQVFLTCCLWSIQNIDLNLPLAHLYQGNTIVLTMTRKVVMCIAVVRCDIVVLDQNLALKS